MGAHGGAKGGDEPQGNDRVPIRSAEQIPWPRIRLPHECARAVYVGSIIPHARVRIYANVTELIGDQLVYVGYDDNFPLTRPLTSTDSLTATQEAFGLVSQPSNPAVAVGPQSKPLARPEIDPRLYACGRIVNVTNLSPSTHVEVYTSQTLPVPIDAAHLIGTAECTGTAVAVATQPLQQGWHVTARQMSCPGTAHEIHSPESHSKPVGADPSPMKPPVLEKPIVGNDVVTLHGLYVGAGINIKDSTAAGAPSLGGGLATSDSNWAVLHPRRMPRPPSTMPPRLSAPPAAPGPAWTPLPSSTHPSWFHRYARNHTP